MKRAPKFASILLIVLVMALSACSSETPTPAPTQDPGPIQTQAAATVVADMTKMAPPPTAVPTATVAPTPIPPPPGPTPDPNIPVAIFPPAVSGGPGAIANYNTLVMSGPGESYVVYGAFLGGVTAQVIGKSEDGLWWAVSVPVAPNGTGWVSSGWVTVSGVDSVPTLPTPPVPPTVALVPPGESDPQATATTNTYVRSGPNGNYPAYGIAPAGMGARVIGQSEDLQWWLVRLDPAHVGVGNGWVYKQYTQAKNVDNVQLVKSPGTAENVEPPPPPASGAPVATSTDFVNVRTGPGTNYYVIGVANPNASAEVVGKSEDGQWWQVKIPTAYSADGLGWVMGSYVYTQNTGSVPVVAAPAAPPPVAETPPPASTTGCSLVSQAPADYTVYAPGTQFTTTWVLKNTGSVAWDTGSFDLAYGGAVNDIRFHDGPDRYDLPITVNPGATYDFSVSMIAPFDAGTYGELWSVANGSTTICQFYIYITVQ